MAVNSARCNGENPRRNVRNSARFRAGVPAGADDGDSLGHSVQGADSDAIDHVVDRIAADGQGDDVDAVGYGGVEGVQRVGIEARVLIDLRPAYLVVGDARPGRASLGGSVSDAEDAGSGHHVAAGCRQRVGSVTFGVARVVHRPIRFAGVSLVPFDEVASSD